ncbi:putative tape measure protein [Serratia phage vB_SmaS_Stoker]|uniref:Tape measure protein n=1 Tax=Serratia phage vB_SmaS_Stoker TaxID=2902692 RepID=A0AC61TQE7_9CAUD|nr:putative tape measure protein [Serratia phage vB_SmaS_Stoker]UGO53768.1 putative tape measure protein [Serratia phage vB_SmaS_Stoker]
MAIINTLLTITDKMTPGLKKAEKGVEDFSNKSNKKLKETEKGANSLKGAFDNIKNFDTKSLDGFSNSLRRVDTQLVSAEGSAAKFLVRVGMLGGGLVLGAGLLFKMASASAAYVKSMREAAETTGSSIQMLQQLNLLFGDTGITIEKYAEMNASAMKSMGQGFSQGTGAMVKSLTAAGIDLQQFNVYLNQTDGGLKAIIHAYYELQSAGKSKAEIAQAMESMASGASGLMNQLSKLKTEQEALTAIQSTHAGVTEEAAAAYAAFDAKVDELRIKFDDWKANALAPTVVELNNLLDILNGNWEGTNFTKWMKDFYYGGDTIVAKFLRDIDGVSALDVPGEALDRLQGFANLAQSNYDSIYAKPGGWEKPGKDPKGKKGAKDNSAAKLEAEKENARKWLEQIDINNAEEQTKAELNYREQLRKLDKFLKDKAVTQAQYDHGVAALNAELDEKTRQNTYNRRLAELQDQKGQMLLTENQYNEKMLDLDKTFTQQKIDAQYYTEMERLKFLHDSKLMAEEEFQNKMLGLETKRSYDLRRLEESQTNKRQRLDYAKQAESLKLYTDNMNNGINIANQFATAIQNQQEQGTAAWYAAAIATKAMAVAQAIMLANLTAANVAATTPGVGAIAAGEAARSWGYANAAMIAATGIIEVAGARESGGQVQAGKSYLVGEKGPELFTPGTSSGGQITSNKNLREAIDGQAGGVEVVYAPEVHFHGNDYSQEDMDNIVNLINVKFDEKINQAMRYGGVLYKG